MSIQKQAYQDLKKAGFKVSEDFFYETPIFLEIVNDQIKVVLTDFTDFNDL